jgi:hypothetical protein
VEAVITPAARRGSQPGFGQVAPGPGAEILVLQVLQVDPKNKAGVVEMALITKVIEGREQLPTHEVAGSAQHDKDVRLDHAHIIRNEGKKKGG